MSNKKYSKGQTQIAQDILRELQDRYRVLKANSGQDLYFQLRDYIKQTYLTEKDGE